MSWFSQLKKKISINNIRKIQPGKVLVAATKAAADIHIPGAQTALNIENAVGKRVDQANRVIDAAKTQIKNTAANQGISQAAAAGQVAGKALSGAEAALGIQNNSGLIMMVIVIVGLLLLMRR